MVCYRSGYCPMVEGEQLKQLQRKLEICWPHGCQSAAMVAVMLDAEYIWLAMDKLFDTPKHRSMGEYGPKRGVDNILEALDSYNVKATFFVPGIVAEAYPDVVKRVAAKGHEIALHGYRHEDFAKLSPCEQQEALKRGKDVLEKLLGKSPTGFRLPEGGCTEETMGLIQEAGFLYDNSMFDHDFPYRTGEGLVEIPIRWELLDFPYLAWGGIFPAGNSRIAIYDDVLDNWLWELEASCDMGYCYVISFTPQTVGSPGRMFMVNTVLERLKRKNVWIATGEEISRYVKANF